MEAQKKRILMNKTKTDKTNWPLVLMMVAFIALLYFIASYAIAHGTFERRHTMYCQYERDLSSDPFVAREECVIMKLYSKDLNEINWTKYYGLGGTTECTESFDEVESCEGGTMHFARFRLDNFCETDQCDVDGVICGAYYITYLGNESAWRQDYEEGMFIEHDIQDEAELLNMLKECGV